MARDVTPQNMSWCDHPLLVTIPRTPSCWIPSCGCAVSTGMDLGWVEVEMLGTARLVVGTACQECQEQGFRVTSVPYIKPIMFLVVCHLGDIMFPSLSPCSSLKALPHVAPHLLAVADGHRTMRDPCHPSSHVSPFSAQCHHLQPWAKGFSRPLLFVLSWFQPLWSILTRRSTPRFRC